MLVGLDFKKSHNPLICVFFEIGFVPVRLIDRLSGEILWRKAPKTSHDYVCFWIWISPDKIERIHQSFLWG